MAEQQTVQITKPWWVDFTKEIGGLSLVLVMLVGLYFLGDRYLSDMRDTWDSIEQITKTELEADKTHRENVQSNINEIVASHNQRMTAMSERITLLEQEVRER